MHMGLVIGRVTATRKDDKLIGTKLLITQPIGMGETKSGMPIIAVDTVGAGVGEKVLYVTGSMASRAAPDKDAPIDAAIVGIIDSLDWEKQGG
ncbi:EutN/CcmL family microcompartment protein [Fictibacillus fluitans]|uniref:EutN/CcmL family microcompartment protein n=1 Tax=Fictibacillus fluitans TaxID=3058422 RepID=A0ABT8HTQ0_9BACL|nr:EutN/CcmL family microcompartment protein [Fictibacillus sp. NE201]MDN4523850.1 EutN/CcmL family microcompartment protein [Fictibacillus sp. NE201]